MKIRIGFLSILGLVLALAACASEPPAQPAEDTQPLSAESESAPMGMGMGRGMMARHQATIPDEYAGVTNPITADEESFARGEESYSFYCASCHGDGGMGDGPASGALDPAPVAIAHTSQMLGDDYMFWRISEGGAMEPFNSGMIAWKEILDEEARWDVINYVRALGSGRMSPMKNKGGEAYDPEAEAIQQAEMLDEAVKQGIINEEESALFAQLHVLVDGQMKNGGDGPMTGSMGSMLDETLAEMVAAETINRDSADAFADIHDRLVSAGLMQ